MAASERKDVIPSFNGAYVDTNQVTDRAIFDKMFSLSHCQVV
jgi:hypothetical protein